MPGKMESVSGEVKTSPATPGLSMPSLMYPACAGSCPLPPPEIIASRLARIRRGVGGKLARWPGKPSNPGLRTGIPCNISSTAFSGRLMNFFMAASPQSMKGATLFPPQLRPPLRRRGSYPYIGPGFGRSSSQRNFLLPRNTRDFTFSTEIPIMRAVSSIALSSNSRSSSAYGKTHSAVFTNVTLLHCAQKLATIRQGQEPAVRRFICQPTCKPFESRAWVDLNHRPRPYHGSVARFYNNMQDRGDWQTP